MGRGPSNNEDPPMTKAGDLAAAALEIAEGSGGVAPGTSSDYCSTDQTVQALLSAGAQPNPNDPVLLSGADPVQVISEGRQVGALAGKQSEAMKACIAMGYSMRGVVVSVDSASGKAVLRVSGGRG